MKKRGSAQESELSCVMGKFRETASTDEETGNIGIAEATTTIMTIGQKRHKRHKHKRHKKKKVSHDDADDSESRGRVGDSERMKNSTKVRGKKLERVRNSDGARNDGKVLVNSSIMTNVNNASLGNSTCNSSVTTIVTSTAISGITATSPKIATKKKVPKSGKGKDSGTSSEEERWLDAIESGKLEEVDDELKKIKPKDPKLMTARQRAMFERKTDAEPNPGVERLVSLPSGYKEKVMTAEAIQKAALKSLKRKQLADEKREKDKKKTMERLLKKQESKASKLIGKGKAWKRQIPLISYRLTVQGSCISLPTGQEFPLRHTANFKGDQLSLPAYCSVEGCDNPKKYSCSKTGVPLCSLQCYRANLAAILT